MNCLVALPKLVHELHSIRVLEGEHELRRIHALSVEHELYLLRHWAGIMNCGSYTPIDQA